MRASCYSKTWLPCAASKKATAEDVQRAMSKLDLEAAGKEVASLTTFVGQHTGVRNKKKVPRACAAALH